MNNSLMVWNDMSHSLFVCSEKRDPVKDPTKTERVVFESIVTCCILFFF